MTFRRSYKVVFITLLIGGLSFWLASRVRLSESSMYGILIYCGSFQFALSLFLIFLNRRMSLSITPMGIIVPSMDTDTIPWSMIRSAAPLHSPVDTQLRLELMPGYRPLAKRTGLIRGDERLAPKEQMTEWTIECKGFHASANRIADLITECITLEPAERLKRITELPKRPIHLL